MNRKFWVSGIVISILALCLSYLVHGLWLAGDYMALSALYRGETDSAAHMQWMIIAHFFYGFGLTWIYQRGVSAAAAVGQGLRFGLAVALTFSVSTYLIYFAVQPLPGMLVGKQIVGDVISTCIVGVVLALLNRPIDA